MMSPLLTTTDLIREDVLEFSRLHEINTMRVFVELLRQRVGSPLSLASQHLSLAAAGPEGVLHRHRPGEGRCRRAL